MQRTGHYGRQVHRQSERQDADDADDPVYVVFCQNPGISAVCRRLFLPLQGPGDDGDLPGRRAAVDPFRHRDEADEVVPEGS